MTKRNATAAIIGAGDFIGSAIAKKFAAEGFTVFAGRRTAEKLAPLVADIEGAGGAMRRRARSMPARKTTSPIFSRQPTRTRRWKSASSIPAPM